MADQSPTVLIVDDNEDIRDALRLLFELDDFDVVGEAENGIEALALALKYRPTFVVLDAQMPVLSGELAAIQLRALVPEAAIICFSGVEPTKPEWADHFLSKSRLSELSPLLHRLASLGAKSIDARMSSV